MYESPSKMKRNPINPFKSVRGLLFAVSVFAIAGCGGSEVADERPDRVEFGGTAKLNGSPVQDALISFYPVGAGSGASGKTDSKGKFVMSTYESGDGVIPGDYVVTVVKIEAADDTSGGVPEDDPAYDGEPEDTPLETTNKFPPQFENAKTSGLKVTVKEANMDYALDIK